MAGTSESYAAIHKDLDRLEKQGNWDFVKISKQKRKVLHLGKNNPEHLYRLGSGCLENSLAEQDLEVLADNKLNMYQQWVLVLNSILGCIKKSIACRSVRVILSLYSRVMRNVWNGLSSAGLLGTRETWSYLSETSKKTQV